MGEGKAVIGHQMEMDFRNGPWCSSMYELQTVGRSNMVLEKICKNAYPGDPVPRAKKSEPQLGCDVGEKPILYSRWFCEY